MQWNIRRILKIIFIIITVIIGYIYEKKYGWSWFLMSWVMAYLIVILILLSPLDR
jgi:hypothetical protein